MSNKTYNAPKASAMLPEQCKSCSSNDITIKKTPLGFLKQSCNACNGVLLNPLSVYYVIAYIIGLTLSFFIILNSPAPIEKMATFLFLPILCVFALSKDFFFVRPKL